MIPECDICIGVKLELKERLPNKKAKHGGHKYRVRRFYCPICGYETTIHADGALDIGKYERIEQEAIQQAKIREEQELKDRENREIENRP